MNLELINKQSEIIKKGNMFLKGDAFFKIDNYKTLTFSAAAVRDYGIKRGKYVHFAREGKYWYFIVNDNPAGFRVTTMNIQRPDNSGCRIGSMSLVRLFMQDTKRKVGESFYIQKTGSELNGYQVNEILIDKSIQQIAKNQ